MSELNDPTQKLKYHNALVDFMEYHLGSTLPFDKTYQKGDPELDDITADDIRSYFCKRVFGTEDPEC